MSSQAGPSSSGKSKKTIQTVAPHAPTPPAASSSGTAEDDEESSESSADPDSDEDLEDVQPKRRVPNGETNGYDRSSGASWPKYAPPSGMMPINVNTQYAESAFEWDAMASRPGVQLWAVRVPSDFKPKYLSSLQMAASAAASSSSSASSSGRLGSLKTKHRSYNLVQAGHTSKIRTAINAEGRDPTAGPSAADVMKMDEEELRREGGEEMQGMSLLVPRLSKKGKLFVAPKPVSRHLILEPDTSSSADTTDASSSLLPSFLSTGHTPAIQPATPGAHKRVQPTHLLKFRNQAVGYNTPGPGRIAEPAATVNGNRTMEVDSPVKEKKKRRKSEKLDGEVSTPKKKKAKV